MVRRYAPTTTRPGLGAIPKAFLQSMLQRQAYAAQLRHSVSTPGWAIPMDDEQKYLAIGYHITLVPDVLYPFDMAMVRRIRREFDPSFTPIFRKLIYRADTGGTCIFCHHGLARAEERIKTDPLVMRAPRPGFDLQVVPNYIERWFEEPYVQGSWRQLYSLPKGFIAWTGDVYTWARQTFWEAPAEAKWAVLTANAEAGEQKATDTWDKSLKEAEDQGKTERPYQKRLMDSMGSDDIRNAPGVIAGLNDPKKCIIHFPRQRTRKTRRLIA